MNFARWSSNSEVGMRQVGIISNYNPRKTPSPYCLVVPVIAVTPRTAHKALACGAEDLPNKTGRGPNILTSRPDKDLVLMMTWKSTTDRPPL